MQDTNAITVPLNRASSSDTHRAENRGIGDLEIIEMQNRENRPVGRGIQKLIAVPGAGGRSRLCLSIADNTGHDQIRIVQGRAEGGGERIAQFAAFMDHTGIQRAEMAGEGVARRTSQRSLTARSWSAPKEFRELAFEIRWRDAQRHVGTVISECRRGLQITVQMQITA